MNRSDRWAGVKPALRWIAFVAVPASAWPLLAWLHSGAPGGASLRLDRASFYAGSPSHRSSAAGEPVSLPHVWRRRLRADVSEGSYELRFRVERLPAEEWAVYLPALSMDAGDYLNGRFLGDGGRLEDPISRNWAHPLLFPFSPSLLAAGENVVRVHVVSDVPRFGFLGAIHVGPLEELSEAYSRRYALKITTVWVITACLVMVGVFTAALWMQWRNESSYGWFTVATRHARAPAIRARAPSRGSRPWAPRLER